MNSFFYEIMNKLNMGIIILDQDKKIVFWNQWMGRKTDLKFETVFNCALDQAAPKFLRPKYSKIIDAVLATGQSRFLAGHVHGAFFLNLETEDSPVLKQNIQIERTENNFVLIQVEDITDHYQNVQPVNAFVMLLEKENDEIRQTEEEYRQMAMHDLLTGLPNRLYLMNKLRKRLEDHTLQKNAQIIAVFFIDLDNLKEFNDKFGHRIGDAVLREMSKRLKNTVRSSDTVVRLSGDEFVIFMEGQLDISDIDKVANHVIDQISEPFEINPYALTITCSVGISLFPQDAHDADALLDKAEKALIRIKHSGKANYAFYKQ